jgi:hypothetical protein
MIERAFALLEDLLSSELPSVNHCGTDQRNGVRLSGTTERKDMHCAMAVNVALERKDVHSAVAVNVALVPKQA